MSVDIHDKKFQSKLFEYALAIGDDLLVIGHRLSEWCGHGPTLEEDIALANIALDCIGQAEGFLTFAAELDERGRSADDLAYFRGETEYLNFLALEQPNGDFGYTIARQFLFSAYLHEFFSELAKSPVAPLAALAAKSLKEVRYHLRHSSEWMLRLGDGTAESNRRVQQAVDDLWCFTGEWFDELCAGEAELVEEKLVPNRSSLRERWLVLITPVFQESRLRIPDEEFMQSGSRGGKHSEHLGYILAELQFVQRAIPNAEW
ncbi:MAG: phenylacetate-CoA oxygenase subunit PaaC [Bdellovibrionales bacterium]|nr:phenylacetate-CoA oxygenase subunit PaaC [Bdellovibrionales bacterium]